MDWNKFKSTEFNRRTASVPVPGLSFLFAEGEDERIEVQSMNGEEVFRARERVESNRALGETLMKLVGNKLDKKIDGIIEGLGLSDDLPGQMVYRIASMEFGVKDQECDQEAAVKFADVAIESFIKVTDKILMLTGMGFVPSGESNASGTMSESETP
jgi:hypothetical protein